MALTDSLHGAIDQLAPEKTFKPKKSKPPWVDAEIRLLMLERGALQRKYDKTASRVILDKLLEQASLVEERTERTRCAFMHEKISDALEDNKNFGKEMRRLGLLRTVDDALHGFSPDELNNHFSSISVSPHEDPIESFNIASSSSTEGFSFRPVTANDVILAVAHFKSQARGEDGIPHSIVAKALPVLAPHLAKLFNVSLSRGVFPSSWKKARIIALKKVSTPSSPSEFRPIALLCFLSKVLEKLAHDQIVDYLQNSKILDPFQVGFRKHHCTQSALLKLTNDILMGMGKKQATLLLQFDFSKAFDTISPSKLLVKLRDLGFSRSSLTWICSYLCGRTQCVFSKSTSSNYRETNLGVPQGSVLGPLLFCLYVNDLRTVLGNGPILRLLYADDLQVYLTIPPELLIEGLITITETARTIANWASRNSLTLNTTKTRAIIFGSSHTVRLFNNLNYPGISIADGENIKFVNEIKSLGVILDNTLSWKPQINQVAKRVNCALFGLRFIKACTTQALRIRLVQSLITSHLDYCSVVYQDASLGLKARLQWLSNAAIRYIFSIGGMTRMSP